MGFRACEGVNNVVFRLRGRKRCGRELRQGQLGKHRTRRGGEIAYDPSADSHAKLLEIYFTVAHDPTEVNRQGPDEERATARRSSRKRADQERFARLTSNDLNAAHVWEATDRDPDRAWWLLSRGRLSSAFRSKSHPLFPIYHDQRPAEDQLVLRQKFPAIYKG